MVATRVQHNKQIFSTSKKQIQIKETAYWMNISMQQYDYE